MSDSMFSDIEDATDAAHRTADLAGFAAAARQQALTVYATVTQIRAGRHTAPKASCPHDPPCPPADAVDHDAARIVASHPEQDWNLLCNGIIVFTDTGELIPDDGPCGCHIEDPHRGPAPHTNHEEN